MHAMPLRRKMARVIFSCKLCNTCFTVNEGDYSVPYDHVTEHHDDGISYDEFLKTMSDYYSIETTE